MTKAISQPALFKQIGYEPHQAQDEIYQSRTRNQVVACGRRFGKSDLGGHRLVTESFRTYFRKSALEASGKRDEFWIVGPEYSDAEKEFRVLYDTLKRLEMPFDRPGTYNDPIGGNLHVSLWGGKFQVHGKSAKYPETLVGEGLSGVILAEAAKLKEVVWTKFIRATLADFNGWAMMTSTPEGKNWFHRLWQMGQDPNIVDWESWRRPSWLNPHVFKTTTVFGDVLRAQKILKDPRIADPRPYLEQLVVDSEILALLQDLTEPTFNQEIAAMFTDFVGRVFKDFDEETHVTTLTRNPGWELWGAVDWGFTNPSVWLLIQVSPFGEVEVLGEVYEAGLTPDEFADTVLASGLAPSGLQGFYPDPASPGDTRILERKLRVRARGGTGGELKHRLDAIRKGLQPNITHVPDTDPARRPMLMFDRSCTQTINDMLNYKYPDRKGRVDTNEPEAPLKKDDHGPEALGRFYAGRIKTPQDQTRRARQSRSTLVGARR